MATPYLLNVVAPAGEVFSGEVEFTVVPGVEGELGILARHAPLIAGLGVGILRYTREGRVEKISIGGGFVEMADNKATVLAKTAETASMIDRGRAEAAKERAEQRLHQKGENIDLLRAEAALKRAISRLQTLNK
ncbi:MAG: F0F1 ATP synthase subunit epsilon [Gracilibacteraceae bacterium]|jgi:F-type H+-transporting ATPase subunit epsilon|nr:F0F1 ATP synthase subunit epsilon [Gracilibacteraceae bacterium]